jgi:uncharacterized protein (DUF2384 family)
MKMLKALKRQLLPKTEALMQVAKLLLNSLVRRTTVVSRVAQQETTRIAVVSSVAT